MNLETIAAFGTAALGNIKTMTDLSATITNTKVKEYLNGKIAELQSVILAARQQMLELQDKYARVLEENKRLKEAVALKSVEKPKTKLGCYTFDGDDGLYCTACYDTKGAKSRTTKLPANLHLCLVCRAVLGAG